MCSVASTAEVTNLVVAVGAVTGHHWPRPKVDHPELVLPMTTGGCVDLTALRDYMMGDNSHNRPLVRAWCSGLCPASDKTMELEDAAFLLLGFDGDEGQ